MLCELTRKTRWLAYVHDLFDQQDLLVPRALADRLVLAMR